MSKKKQGVFRNILHPTSNFKHQTSCYSAIYTTFAKKTLSSPVTASFIMIINNLARI
jgi:hypothetical protein